MSLLNIKQTFFLAAFIFANIQISLAQQAIVPAIDCIAGLPATSLDLEIIAEINRLRTQPKSYINDIKREYASLNAQGVYKKNDVLIKTQEGQKAVKEAIRFLKKIKPVGSLERASCLSLSAQDHVTEQGGQGLFGHTSLNGSNPNDRAQRYSKSHVYCGENIAYGSTEATAIVIQLLVDDGVPNRGHRTNLFRPEFNSIGVASGYHSQYGYMSSHTLCRNAVSRDTVVFIDDNSFAEEDSSDDDTLVD